MTIKCPKCHNTGDIIVIGVGHYLCWCPCGNYWLIPGIKDNAENCTKQAKLTSNAGDDVPIGFTNGRYKAL